MGLGSEASAFFGAAGAAGSGGGGGTRSLRFNSADSAYLSRTPASAGNRKTWTFSCWVKRSTIGGSYQNILSAANSVNDRYEVYFDTSTNQLTGEIRIGGTGYIITTTQVFRDPSAWYHILVVMDTTQATASNRHKFYVNGTQVTNFASGGYPNQDATPQWNAADPHSIGRYQNGAGQYFNGYLADVHFIDGQALDPTSFGEFDTNGIWQPITFAGSYGTNGFKLSFSDNSTTAALGNDDSPNSNTWAVNNFSVASGPGNDSLVDVPVNGDQTDTGVGGEVRGNYTVLNALNKGSNVTLSNGNLESSHAGSSVHSRVVGTIGVSSGKWYYEATLTTLGGQWPAVGVALSKTTDMATYVGAETGTFGYYGGGGVNGGGAGRTYSTYTTNDVIGVAIDLDNNRLTFYKNGANAVTSGTTYENLTAGETYVAAVSGYGSSAAWVCNFGARSFAYTAPSGFKALCTANLPAPTIEDGSAYMEAVTWSGDGTSSRAITGINHSPDLVWIKNRNSTWWHCLSDAVRGANKCLFSNATDAELTDNFRGYTSSLDSNGFTVAAGSTSAENVNASGLTYVAWTWDAGSSTVTNNDGSISSQVRASASSGFSVVAYSAGTSNSSVGHGLGVAPSLIIAKSRTGTSNWVVYHASLGASIFLELNTTSAQLSLSSYWGTPSSTTFGVSVNGYANNNGDMIAYCFAPVAGYSAFGSYTGNGSATDGPFIFTGMRPRWIIIKGSSFAGESWFIWDTSRDPYNLAKTRLLANESLADNQDQNFGDILSSGFKLRNSWGGINGNGNTYIYAAFAENPFALNARAR